MDLTQILELLKQYPSVSHIELANGGGVKISFFPPKGSVEVKAAPYPLDLAEMPPDDVMLFASTPTFDDMVDASQTKD